MSSRTVLRKRTSRVASATEFPFQEEDVRRISTRLQEPRWLRERRLEAWRRYQSLPMPTTSEEAWRRTDIRSLPSQDLRLNLADEMTVDREFLQPLTSESHGALMVLHPGHASLIQSHDSLVEQGVLFTDWPTAIREHAHLLKESLGSLVSTKDGKFAAAAASFAEDGFFVYVPQGVEAQVPLHSVYWAPGVDAAFFSRLLVVLDAGSSLTYIHEAVSPNAMEGSAIHSGIVELHIGEGARLTFVELQSWGDHVWNFSHERARVERNGKIDWIFGALGSHLTKSFSELTLSGEGAEGRMSGFYFADGDQHLDHDTRQDHLAPHTTSDLLFKGALMEQSRSVWRGMIYVAPGAQKTDGYQANRNLILSKEARADSIPGLEILADDVRCTHGATVGQLEEEPVYYLMSRGLPRHEAEKLVVEGFFAPIMDRVPYVGVRARFRQRIDDKMSRTPAGGR
jgi:Fe-S cluster assembly protein SufD